MPSLSDKNLTASERGTALVFALVILLILTIIGISAMNTTTLQEKMAHNLKDKNLAFQAAESALQRAETFIAEQVTVSAIIASASITNDGLHKPSSGKPIWETSDLWISGTDILQYKGLDSSKLSAQPKYIIEDLGEVLDTGGSLVVPGDYKAKGKNLFRITARGVGGTGAAVAMVQSTFEKRF